MLTLAEAWRWVQVGVCIALGMAIFRAVQERAPHVRVPERVVKWLVVLGVAMFVLYVVAVVARGLA